MPRAGLRSWLAVAGGLIITVFVAAAPVVHFVYRAPSARAALETAVTLVAALVSFLCAGRYARHRRPPDLAIAMALGLIAVIYPLLAVLPEAAFGRVGEQVGEWAPVGARALAAALLAMAATLSVPSRRWWCATGGALAVAAVLGVTGLVWLGPGHDPVLLGPAASDVPRPLADPLTAALQLGTAGLFGWAAVRFTRVGAVTHDRLRSWLGVSGALAAVASLNYALFPNLGSGWVHTGDVFRAGAVLAAALGAAQEITSYWAAIARSARVEERRRLARDLHDGIAQELAFLATHAHEPPAVRACPEWLAQLQAAADRGLAESRRAISALVTDSPLSLGDDLVRTAAAAARPGASVDVQVARAATAPAATDPTLQEALVRIVREAVTNATRHGRATHVVVSFSDATHPVLRVSDDGIGFDPDERLREAAGFGLVNMRERAQALGAAFHVRSAPGEGTTVEVAWP